MKFIKNQSAIRLDSLQRFLFPAQLAVVCLVLPVLFLIGIKGNEGNAPQQPTEKSVKTDAPSMPAQYAYHTVAFPTTVSAQ